MELRDAIRRVPDYPKPRVMFRDITTLLGNPRALRVAIDRLVEPNVGAGVDKVAGIEAHGFVLGSAVAHQLSVGFAPIRKKENCHGARCARNISSNMALTRSRCTKTRWQPARRC